MVRGTPVRFPSSQDIPAGSPIRCSRSRDSDTRVDRQMSSTSKANRFDFGDCGPLQSPKATQPDLRLSALSDPRPVPTRILMNSGKGSYEESA